MELCGTENVHFPGFRSQMLLSISGLRPGPVRPCCAGPNRPALKPVGIAETTNLGSKRKIKLHVEVPGFCNQYKYALPSSDRKMSEAREALPLVNLCLRGRSVARIGGPAARISAPCSQRRGISTYGLALFSRRNRRATLRG